MNCPNCGSEISDLAVVCPNCGASVGGGTGYSNETGEEKANIGFIVLAVLFPIVGIILGIVENSKGNKKVGKTYIITAIISWVVFGLLGCCVGFGFGLLGGISEAANSSSYYSMLPVLF